MGKVTAGLSMSLDGFIAGPNDSPVLGLGEGGERLHEWVYDLASWREQHGLSGGVTSPDSEMLEEALTRTGAFVMGRRMFDHGEGPWGDAPPFHMPVFVVTHRAHETLVKEGGTTFVFVTEGIERALEQARAAAADKDVAVAGGASVVQQLLRAGLLDEILISLVPILLGGGVRLFSGIGAPDAGRIELVRTRVIESPGVTHLRYRVVK